MKNLETELIERLLIIINNNRAIQQSIADYGLFYKLGNSKGLNSLIIGTRKNAENEKRIEFFAGNEEFDSDFPSKEILFATAYDLLKYLYSITYSFELHEIFEYDEEKLKENTFFYYRDRTLNEELKKVTIEIKNNRKLKEIYTKRTKITNEILDEHLDDIFDEEKPLYKQYHSEEIAPIEFEKELYTGKISANNSGMVWDNISDFRILGYDIRYEDKKSEIPFYSLDVKFQILSFIETEERHNYYTVEISDFIIFPVTTSRKMEERLLSNNLKLLYSLGYDELYSMILREYPNFKEYKIGYAEKGKFYPIEEFKEEVLSKLAKYLVGEFYVGTKTVYIFKDIMKLEFEFKKRNLSGFQKNLFAEFVICSTGIRVADLNTVNSFYVMIEKIDNNNKTEEK